MTTQTMSPFKEWEGAADAARVGDPLWSVQAYRLGVYAIECHNFDRRTDAVLAGAQSLGQVTRAIGSIAANIAEGYSRGSIADRTRFYGYALGSTREAISWYDTLRAEIGPLVDERQATLIQIRRLLLTMLKRMRPDGDMTPLRDFAPATRTPEP